MLTPGINLINAAKIFVQVGNSFVRNNVNGHSYVAIDNNNILRAGVKKEAAAFGQVTALANKILGDQKISFASKNEVLNAYKKIKIGFDTAYTNANFFYRFFSFFWIRSLQQEAYKVIHKAEADIELHELSARDKRSKHQESDSLDTPPKNNGPQVAHKTAMKPTVAVSKTKALLAPTPACTFKSKASSVGAIYQGMHVRRHNTSFRRLAGVGGAGSVAHQIYTENKDRMDVKVGVFLAANSGLPGGKLAQHLEEQHAISLADLNLPVQEESVLSNAFLTMFGGDITKQQEFYANTLAGKWGMVNNNPNSYETIQGVNFKDSTNANDFNQVYLVDNCKLSKLEKSKADGKSVVLVQGEECPVSFIFADSVNANTSMGKSAASTMRRTCNKKAVTDYSFFRECVKVKLRAALDGAATQGVTHPLVALLSGGIYAGDHKAAITHDYNNILREVLSEAVGPNGEQRGQYFEDVIIPTLAH